jgi:non-ribosomal peptide synthetase component F
VPYRDYVAWSEAFRTEPGYDEAMRFWEGVLRPELPAALDLPTDRPRPAARSYRGGTVHHVVAHEIYAPLRTTCQRLGVTLYVALLSAFEVLLSRLTTQQDLVVGVPAAGQAAFGQDVVGYCVNVLPLRGRVEGHQLFSEFARATRGLVLDAFEHQRVSLGDLVRRFDVPRDPSRLPLVEVVFNCSRYFAGVEFTGLNVASHENRRQAVYHDLFLNAIESGGQLVIDWDYNADLFDADTLERWIGHLEALLGAIAADPNTALDDLPIMTADDAAALRSEWGGPGAITRT